MCDMELTECKGALLVHLSAERAKCRRSGVLAEVAEADRRRYDKEEGRNAGQDCEGLGAVERTVSMCAE